MAELTKKAIEGKRRRRARYRAKKRAEAEAKAEARLLKQLGPDPDWHPSDAEWGWTLEQHRENARWLLSLPRLSDLPELPGPGAEDGLDGRDRPSPRASRS
jgi:hypothetical protein